MRKILILIHSLLFIILVFSCTKDDHLNEPVVNTNDTTTVVTVTDTLGYSLQDLQEAKKWADSNTQTAAVIVYVDGKLLFKWGNTAKKYLTHSCRKSFMSALYGKYVQNGTIDLEATMSELNIDDVPQLTSQEKTAKVIHCLQACSGVYHTAEAETDGMHNLKPARDTYLPGTFWIYNNWDFNVLRTIFEQETGKNFYSALKRDILDPIGANFELSDSVSWPPTRSIHPAYMFQISATDMANFGQLMLQNGLWNGRQIIPEEWIQESTKYCWDAEIYNFDGYSYMWWVATNNNRYSHLPNCELPEGTYSARGAGGHWIEVIPEYNIVFVHRTDTWNNHNVRASDIGRILQMILDAKIEND